MPCFGVVRLFFLKFFISVLQFLLIFCKRMDVEKSQKVPLSPHPIFKHYETSFCLILDILSTYPIFFSNTILIYFKTGVFSILCDFFIICFYRSPLSIFTRNQKFCEHRGLLKISALYQEIFFEKSSKIFFNFSFFFRFSAEQDGVFCCFPLAKNTFRALCISLRVFFGTVNLMKFQQGCFFSRRILVENVPDSYSG